MSLYALLLELNMVIAVWLALAALQRDPETPGRMSFFGMAVAAALWCAGELLIARGVVSPWTGVRVLYLGVALLPSLWLGVAANVARLPVARRIPWFPLALITPELLLWGLLFLEPWSALYLRAPRVPGPLWWVHAVYAYALVAIGAAIFVLSGIRTPRRDRRLQRLAIGIGVLAPLLVNLLHALSGLQNGNDPTPVFLGPVLLVMSAAVFPRGFLDVLPLAHRDLLAHLPVGVVLADRSGVVIELNRAACRLLRLERGEVLGRALDAVLHDRPPNIGAEISDVEFGDRTAARFALLLPVGMKLTTESAPPSASDELSAEVA